MQKIRQIVSERLKARATAGGHPGAELLTAFAERSLSQRERASVLSHLAACGDCREVVALALPATEPTETASIAARRGWFSWGWFSWPLFRWGFAAAGVVLIVLGAVEFEQRKAEREAFVTGQMAAKQVASAVTGVTPKDQSSSQTASAIPPVAPPPAPTANDKLASNENFAKKDVRKLWQGESAQTGRRESTARSITLDAPASGPAAKQASRNSPSPPAMSETVEVQAQPVVAETESAQVAQAPAEKRSPEALLGGYTAGPFTRAKPAGIASAQADTAGGVLVTPKWSITAVGSLRRSLDQGKSWQDIDVNANSMPSASSGAIAGEMKSLAKEDSIRGAALKASSAPVFFRAVEAAGNEVWAGGSNAALFHSVDAGDHWTRVLPSFSGAVLTGDVLSVEFQDSQHGTVTTSTPEIWITSDGGQSWTRQ